MVSLSRTSRGRCRAAAWPLLRPNGHRHRAAPASLGLGLPGGDREAPRVLGTLRGPRTPRACSKHAGPRTGRGCLRLVVPTPNPKGQSSHRPRQEGRRCIRVFTCPGSRRGVTKEAL